MTETAQEYEQIEQDQRAAHESLYLDDVDDFELIDSTH